MRHSDLDPDDLKRPDWNSLKANYDKHDVGEAYFKGRVEQMGLHVEHWGIDMRDHDEGLIFDNKMDLRLWEPQDGQQSPPYAWAEEPAKRIVVPHDDDHGKIDAVRMDDDMEVSEVFEPASWQCRGLIDVKTKANRDWLGVTNLRHLAHYAEWAAEYEQFGVPVAIYFTMVDMDAEHVGDENLFAPITTDWPWEELVDHWDTDSSRQMQWGEMKAVLPDYIKEAFHAPDGNKVVRFEEDYFQNFDWVVSEVL